MNIELSVETRAKPINGKFQADVIPNRVLDKKDVVDALAKDLGLAPAAIEVVISGLDDLVVRELGRGNRVDLGLVSFLPKLSGALSARDADPSFDGLRLCGSARARHKLVNAIDENLVPVNKVTGNKVVLSSVATKGDEIGGRIKAGTAAIATGIGLVVVEGRADEGIWLQSRQAYGYKDTGFKARILFQDADHVEFVFDALPPPGKYSLVLAGRGGNTTAYRAARRRLNVEVVES